MIQDFHRTSFLNQTHKNIYERIIKLLSSGEVYVGAMDFSGARKKYSEALQLCQETFGAEEIETALSLQKLGDLSQIEGQFAFSKELYSQAMEIFSKNKTENEALIASLHHSLGLLYKHTEKNSKAIEYLMKSADNWNCAEEPEEALVSLKFCLEMIEKGSIKDSKSITNVYELLGDIYTQLEDFSLAKEYLSKAKKIKEEEFGKNNHRLGSVYLLLGFLARRENELDNSVKLIKRGLKFCAKSEENNNLTIMARGYAILGSLEETSEKYENALEHYHTSYSLFRHAIKKPNDIRLARVLSYIGTGYYFQGNHVKSLEYFQRSLEMTQKIKIKDLDFIATLNKNLGTLYVDLSDLEKARECLEKAINLKEEIMNTREENNEDLDLAFLYRKLGIVNANMLRFESAKVYFEKSFLLYSQKFGEFDEETVFTWKLLEEAKLRVKTLQRVEMGL